MGIETVLAAVGLAASAAGTAASMKASSDSRSAMNREVVKAVERQKEFQRQATPIQQESLKGSGREEFESGIESGTRAAQGRYSELPNTKSFLPVDESRLSGQLGQARSSMARGQGYQNAMFQQWLKNQLVGNRLGVLSNLASSAASMTPALTALAGQTGADLAGLGSLMSTAGNLSMMYGASRAGQMWQPTSNSSSLSRLGD